MKEHGEGRGPFFWEVYKIQVDLYKFWFDATVRINVFYYAVTGAVVSFYFSRPQDSVIKWSLAFPALMSVGICLIFAYGARLNEINRRDLVKLMKQLELPIGIEFAVLTAAFGLTAALSGATAIALIVLLVVR